MQSLSIIFLLVSSAAHAALPGAEAVVLSGSFVQRPPELTLRHADLVQGTIVGEWPKQPVASGRAATGVFVTPATIEFEITGYPTGRGMRFWLEDVANPAQTLNLRFGRYSADAWFTRRWQLPPAWQHRKVRLVVEDRGPVGPNSWVGFTLPREGHVLSLDSIVAAAYFSINLLWEFLLLLLPGLATALWFSRKRLSDAQMTLTVLLTGCGLAGLLCFFCFVLNFRFGLLFSEGTVAASIAAIVVCRSLLTRLLRSIQPILLIWITGAALYTSTGLLYRNQNSLAEIAQDRFFTFPLPPDNVLPFMLGEAIFNHAPFRPTFFGDIQSSDRPPLQTGLVLLQHRFWSDPEPQYLVLAVLLQTSWIPALWVLLRRTGITGPPLLASIAIPALSYFAFVHEIFVWPKLLSAAFGLLALSCFGWITDRKSTLTDAVLGGACTALAMLSHSGVMMTVIGFAFVTAFARKSPLRWSAALLGTAAIVYVPWMFYQKFFDPPGDALLKLHLAGVIDRNHSLSSLLVSSYGRLGFAGWLARRWTNFRFLFWPVSEVPQFHDAAQTAYWISHLSFFNLFPSLGWANIGFLLCFGGTPPLRRVANRMLLIAFASLAVWLLIMFAPEATDIHQGSFAMMLLFFAALTLYTAAFSQRAAGVLVILQLLTSVPFVIFAKPMMEWQPTSILDIFPDVGMFALFAFTLTSLAVWFYREWRYGGPLST